MSRCEGNDDQKPDPHGRVRQSYEVRHPTGQRQVTRGQSSVKPHAAAARFQAAIDHLSALLQSTVAAEELAISWHGNHSPSDSVTGKQQQMGLADLKRLLDSGRRVNGAQGRGIPTWIVVSTAAQSKALTISFDLSLSFSFSVSFSFSFSPLSISLPPPPSTSLKRCAQSRPHGTTTAHGRWSEATKVSKPQPT